MYVILNKETKEVVICTSKREIGRQIKRTDVTVWKYLTQNVTYEDEKWIIWQNIEVIKSKKRGRSWR